MITDRISEAASYKGISPGIKKALTYIENNDLALLEEGRYNIEGDDLFFLIQGYEPKAIEDGKCEAHRNYIDIQYVIEGSEYMGYGPLEGLKVTEAYDVSKDRLFVEWSGQLIAYDAGMFAVFFPQDAHMPGIKAQGCTYVKKAVFKVKVL